MGHGSPEKGSALGTLQRVTHHTDPPQRESHPSPVLAFFFFFFNEYLCVLLLWLFIFNSECIHVIQIHI